MAGSQATSADAAARYASALFDLAREADAVDAVARDLAAVRALLGESDELMSVAASPIISESEKAAAFDAIAGTIGLGDLTRNFLGVVAGAGRAGGLPAMIDAFEEEFDRWRGAVRAEVQSAKPLSADQVSSISAAIREVTGQEVQVRAEVRPELLGGLVIKVGSRMFDNSLKTKLSGMLAAMKGA